MRPPSHQLRVWHPDLTTSPRRGRSAWWRLGVWGRCRSKRVPRSALLRASRNSPDHNLDDLTLLIDSAAQAGPAPGDLHVRLIDESPIAGGVPGRTREVDELRGERLPPPVD